MVLKYYCFGNGIGPNAKALTVLGINAVCVGISEVDVDAIVVNHAMNGALCSVSVPNTREEIVEALKPFRLRANLQDLETIFLRKLYTAHFATKNMGDIGQIHSLPTSCDLIVYCFNDLEHLPQFRRIMCTTPNKPKVLLFETLPTNADSLESWLSDLSQMGYYSVSRTVRASECGIPIGRGRHFVMSNLRPFSMDFTHLANPVARQLGGLLGSNDEIASVQHGQVVLADGRVRSMTRLEKWLLAGYGESDHRNVAPHVTGGKLMKLIAVSAPVYLFAEIFRNLFVSPLSTISTVISVPSNRLEAGRLRHNILVLLKEQYEGRCIDGFYGFISNVVELKEIRDAYVSNADSSNKFHITYTMRSIKPRMNNTYSGQVKACYSTGIVATIASFEEYGFVCNVLVMANTFDKKTKVVSFPSCGCSFSQGSTITFQITELVYDQDSRIFQCIGTHRC